MNVVCPQCNATYRFPESRVPDRKAFFSCKRCGRRVTIEPPGLQARPEAPRNLPAAAAQTPAGHGSALVGAFPEVTAFASEKYALDQLLLPDKKGRYNNRLNKLKLKLLAAVQGTMDRLLDPDEQVVHLAGATAYYPAEMIFGNGWLTLLYNRYIVVCTNKRLVAVNTDYKMTKPTHYLFQFPFNEIKKVSRGLFGSRLMLTRKKGKRRIFNGIKGALTAEMKRYIDARIDPSLALADDAAPVENLCPSCFAPLGGGLSTCPKCHALFKSPRKAALRSLALPGWGDVYLGHRFLGFCEMIGSLIVLGVACSLLLSGKTEDLIIGVVILLFYNGMDGLLTLHMGKKGYSLEKGQPRKAPLGRLSASQA